MDSKCDSPRMFFLFYSNLSSFLNKKIATKPWRATRKGMIIGEKICHKSFGPNKYASNFFKRHHEIILVFFEVPDSVYLLFKS